MKLARPYTSSSSFQMALLFTVLCGSAVFILAYFSYYFTQDRFISETEQLIDTEIDYITAWNKWDDIDAILSQTEKRPGRTYLIFSEKRPEILPRDLKTMSEGLLVFNNQKNGRKYAAKIITLQSDEKLLIGVDIQDISAHYNRMQVLSIMSIVFMLAVIGVSYMIAVFVVKSTNKIASTAQEIIQTGDLSRRLEVGARWDDLSNMAAVLNVLLGRIESLMQGVRQVSDNIAHDLRTPLTRLRNNLENLKLRDDKPEYGALIEEADHLLNTFNALLRISRIEAERQCAQFKDTDIAELLADAIALYEPLAEEKNIIFVSNLIPFSLRADRDLLFQAFNNLIDNAVKYAPERSKICISMHAFSQNERHRLRVEISDEGCGISVEDQRKVFHRFYRTEAARNEPGTGLGLSLAKAAIELHRGEINLEAAHGGGENQGLKVIVLL